MNDNQELTLDEFIDLHLETVIDSSAIDNKKLTLEFLTFNGIVEPLLMVYEGNHKVCCTHQNLDAAVRAYNFLETKKKGDRRPLHADSLYGYINSHHLDYKNGKRLILVTTISEDAGGPVSHFKVWKDKTLLYCGNDLTDALWVLRS